MKKIFELISFDILKRPKNVKSFAKRIITINIVGLVIMDILAFALAGAELAISVGLIWLAICLILLYFTERTIESLFITFKDYETADFNKLTTKEATKIILDICNTVKHKVFKANGDNLSRVETSEIIQKCKSYLENTWNIFVRLPILISNVIILIITLILSILFSVKNSSTFETLLILALLVSCIISYFLISKKRIHVKKAYRKNKKENEAIVEVLYTELKTIDFISDQDFNYHASKLIECIDVANETEKTERLELNKIFIKRSLIATALIVLIMILKFATSKDFSPQSFMAIIASSFIYATILSRITTISENVENFSNIIIELKTLNEDFQNYNEIYKSEKNKKIITTALSSVSISEFEATQDTKNAFRLINQHTMTLKSGETYLVYGHTGCGKSTLLNLLTGKLSLKSCPIQFSNGMTGYLNSISYQTDKAMANNFVLNELALTDEYYEIDIPKLLEILKGLHLYEVILAAIPGSKFDNFYWSDDEKVLELLKAKKTEEFSSGQKQRLALAKLLYSLDDTIQLVALDEPFNRLDDIMAQNCMSFCKSYIMRKNRILVIATHQVDICRKFADKEISFSEEKSNHYYLSINF